jgi:hypothetical protein
VAVNSETTLMFWEIGAYINSIILDSTRAAYGKRIVSALATQLMSQYGKSFELRNLRRMKSFPTNGSKHIDYYLDKNNDDF